VFFFFSSRRRHTRSDRDWSSDVCSSDLWDLGRTARAWAELMRRLGYTRYVAQGGDVGAGVTDAMGRQGPEGLIGIHTNLLVPARSEERRVGKECRAARWR